MKIKFSPPPACLPALLPALLLPLVAACATPAGVYPDLSIRDAERVTGTMQPVEPAPYVPDTTPTDVLDELDQLAGDAANAHQSFLREAPGLSAAFAAGRSGEVGTPAWSNALVALGSLEAARSRTLIALADLDRLYVAAATDSREITRIEAARQQVMALVEEEDRMILAIAGTAR